MAAADFLGVIKNASMGAFKTRDVFVYESALVITTGDSLSTWVRAFSHEFGPLGTLIFSGWVQRIDERRTARGRLAPEELAAERSGSHVIPVATVTGADLSRGFLNTTLKLALVSGETVKLSWTKAGNDDDMVKAWLRRALGPKLLDQGVAT